MTLDSPSDSNDGGHESEDVADTGEKFKWTSEAVTLLLNFRFEREAEFANPVGKKIDLWDKISKELIKHGYIVSGPLCFAKYRNLLSTYRRRKDMGEMYYRWEHFDLMDLHLGHQASRVETQMIEETYEEPSNSSYYIIQSVEEVGLQDNEQEEVEGEEDEAMEVEDTEKESTDKTSDSSDQKEFQWSPDAVKLLLNLRLPRNYAWLKPNCRKSELWENVSREMQRQNFNVPAHMCDTKYRNLLKTYRSNKEKVDRGEACHWPYYDMFSTYLDFDSDGSQSIFDEGKNSIFYNLVREVVVTRDDAEGEEVKEAESSEGPKEKAFQWNPTSTKLLLILRYEREDEFESPLSRKSKLWDDISREMKKRKGFLVPGHVCHAKYRNLLNTYRKVNEKRKSGQKFNRWEFFDLMDSHLGQKNLFPSKNSKKHEFTFNDLVQEEEEEEEEEDEEVVVAVQEEVETHTIKTKRKRPKHSLANYLELKLKADEKRTRDYIALEEKRLRLEQKRLDLEQKKIDVLKSLVLALKQTKK